MMLTTKGRYAVMAMVDLAAQGRGKPVSLADVAARQEIALNYLEQIFAKLRKAALVHSVRGPGGGYVLAREPEALWVSDIILAVDESIRITRCNPYAKGGCMQANQPCLTHDLWEGLGNQIYAYLRSVSLADICARRVPVNADKIPSAQPAEEGAGQYGLS